MAMVTPELSCLSDRRGRSRGNKKGPLHSGAGRGQREHANSPGRPPGADDIEIDVKTDRGEWLVHAVLLCIERHSSRLVVDANIREPSMPVIPSACERSRGLRSKTISRRRHPGRSFAPLIMITSPPLTLRPECRSLMTMQLVLLVVVLLSVLLAVLIGERGVHGVPA